ncbi:MAG: EAL domain-containing protein [Firmicutes bacterium]|nr:EAL domain-containing protein [Bacillota bacterium]
MAPKRRILVVEDNRLNREMLVEILSDKYTTFEAENGLEALDILKQHSDGIALILLDITMPVMDGYAFLDEMKKYPEFSLIPVIVMTQSNNVQDEVSALAHGATDFVPKPYQPEVVLHRIASIINLRETSAMANYLKYDRLTGLYSREYFFQQMRRKLAEDPEQDYCVVCSNIENFRLFNDSFGIQAGDLLLKEVADITRQMVGDSGFCGRFSADRFLCFQKREQERLDRMNFENTPGPEISPWLKNTVIRWGIYEITDRSIPVELMCDRAMMAVKSIKGQYNRFFAVFDETLRNKQLREQNIINSMASALEEKQFSIYYQPKYDLKNGYMVGAEALVRWNHPEFGAVSPGEFIPLFEKNGSIFRLDQYVWENTCAQIRAWQDKGYPLVPISVNISRADLYHADLADTLTALTAKYGVSPEYLHPEITESAYTENPLQITDTVANLRENGFRIEMDDFGSGYSSLNMFNQMNMDILKLDMKMIQNETAKSPNRSILSDIINMAHRMGLKVVAEGVERKDQVDRLKSLGCDYVQGYFFSKPMPAEEFKHLLKSSNISSDFGQKQSDTHKLPGLLIADEDAEYREKVRKEFRHEYRVLDASDADSTVKLLHSCEENGISVIILNATLPRGGASDVLKTIRQNPAYWNIPVLAIIPAPGQDREELLPLALEADDFLCKCHPMFDLHRRVEHLLNVAQLQKREKDLQYEVNRDPLTGLLNRRGFQAALESMRPSGFPTAVCMFDLDNLKTINDTFGHHAGDRIISAFSDLLLRESGNGDILCRYGGDEFILITAHAADAETTEKKAAEICGKFINMFADEPFQSACSAGIAICKANEKPSAGTIEQADSALYRAKQNNKGGCLVYNSDGNYPHKA